jgi:hypothetical protein
LREVVSPLRALIGARFVVVEASGDRTGRLEVLIAPEDQGWVEAELGASGAVRVGTLLDGSSFELTDGSTLDVIARDEPWLAQALDCPQAAPNGLPVIGLPYLVLFRLETARASDSRELERLLGSASEAQLTRVRDAVDAFMPDLSGDLESLIALGRLAREEEPKTSTG